VVNLIKDNKNEKPPEPIPIRSMYYPKNPLTSTNDGPHRRSIG
tara:strand:- start:2439 stop:2567 length:129 start_codon:yes stop_codon:yes gene_type:complete